MQVLLAPLLVALFIQDPAYDDISLHDLGHPSALQVVGTVEVPADHVRETLLWSSGYLEASDPLSTRGAYCSWLSSTAEWIYQHAGYADVRARARCVPDEGRVVVEVEEGERLLAGEPRVKGASALDPEFVRAVLRAGSVDPVFVEFLPAPPGPEPIYAQSVACRLKAEPSTEFWVGGEPARQSSSDRERVEDLAVEAARAAGLWLAELDVLWERSGAGELRPIVVIRDEGPLFTVHEMRFEGEFGEPVEVLQRWAAIPAGTPATRAVRLEAIERLRASGRFGEARARYKPVDGEITSCDLVVHLEQAPDVPPLADHPAEELDLLSRAVRRLEVEAGSSAGLELEATLSPERSQMLVAGLTGAGVPVPWAEGDRLKLHLTVLRSFAAAELARLDAGGEATPLLRLAFDEGGGVAHCAPLVASFEMRALERGLSVIVQAHHAKGAGRGEGKNFDLGFSMMIDSTRDRSQPPLQLSQFVSPSALLYLLEKMDPPPSPDPERLLRTYSAEVGELSLTVDRDDLRLLLQFDFDDQGFQGHFRYGDLDDLRPPEWSSTRGAQSREPEGSPELDAAFAVFEVWRAANPGFAPEWVLVFPAVHALMAERIRRGAETEEEESDLLEPRSTGAGQDSDDLMGTVRWLLESVALCVIERHETMSWPAQVARLLPALTMPATSVEFERVPDKLGWLVRDRDCGPLGLWATIALCDFVGYRDASRYLAEQGNDDTSVEAFLDDCEDLFDLGEGPAVAAVAAAWRELRTRSTGESVGECVVRETFAGCRPEDPDEAWLRAGLSRLWESRLRERFEQVRRAALEGEEGR